MLVPSADGDGSDCGASTPLRGKVRRGESGGPAVDAKGRVVAMIFGGSRSGNDGFAVPVGTVLDAIDGRLAPVDPGPCAG